MAQSLTESVKMALRIAGNDFDEEISVLIGAAKAELQALGITELSEDDPLVRVAVMTYCRLHFGAPADYDRLERSYREQKAQLQSALTYRGGDRNG